MQGRLISGTGEDTAMGTVDGIGWCIVYNRSAITPTSSCKAGTWVGREKDDGRGGGAGVRSVTWKGTQTLPGRQFADQRAFAVGTRCIDERG